uniref:Uncharacterized protein n=1 Tax=viral metagenome TaxID=1070528 RepID=A0A6C0E886_9ZZZZ
MELQYYIDYFGYSVTDILLVNFLEKHYENCKFIKNTIMYKETSIEPLVRWKFDVNATHFSYKELLNYELKKEYCEKYIIINIGVEYVYLNSIENGIYRHRMIIIINNDDKTIKYYNSNQKGEETEPWIYDRIINNFTDIISDTKYAKYSQSNFELIKYSQQFYNLEIYFDNQYVKNIISKGLCSIIAYYQIYHIINNTQNVDVSEFEVLQFILTIFIEVFTPWCYELDKQFFWDEDKFYLLNYTEKDKDLIEPQLLSIINHTDFNIYITSKDKEIDWCVDVIVKCNYDNLFHKIFPLLLKGKQSRLIFKIIWYSFRYNRLTIVKYICDNYNLHDILGEDKLFYINSLITSEEYYLPKFVYMNTFYKCFNELEKIANKYLNIVDIENLIVNLDKNKEKIDCH